MSDTENLAILLTDMVGFTERTSSQSRAQFHALLTDHDLLLKNTATIYNGEWIKSTGDGMLVVFRSPTNAVQCGMAMQDALAEYNYQRDPSEKIHVRIAINLGEVRREKKDIFGEAVNVTARIESLTPDNEVYFSEAVYLAMKKSEVPSELVGEKTLKGIPEPIEVYRVPADQATRLVATGEPMQAEGIPFPFGGMPHARVGAQGSSAPHRRKRRFGKIAAGLALLFLLFAVANQEEEPNTETAQTPTGGGEVSQSGADHKLTIHTQPDDASIRILNIKPVYEPGIELATGRYEIEVSAPEYDPVQRWIHVSEDTELRITLQQSAQETPTQTPRTDRTISEGILRRNDLFLVLSRTIPRQEFYLERHPDSVWADVVRVATRSDRKALQALRRQAEQGNVEAQLGMAWLTIQGKGVSQSLRDAAQWAEKAYASGDPLALWFRGITLLTREPRLNRRERVRALDWIQQSAQRGEALGELTLGMFYSKGEHVSKNEQTAARWLRSAVQQQLPFAEAVLAGLYLEGKGVERDIARGVELLQNASAANDPVGQYYLGILYEKGVGLASNRERAIELYTASHRAGFAEAGKALSRLR